MYPILFRIPIPLFLQSALGPTLPIYSYGLMMVIGFLLAISLGKYLSRRSGIDPELFVNAMFLALIFGILGARSSHIIENWADYSRPDLTWMQNLRHMLNLREGGLTYYGGFLLATPIAIGYALYHRVRLRLGMDIVAICLLIGLGFGRVGCFVNGCCYGQECSLPWSVRFPYNSYAYQEQVRHGEINPPKELVRQTSLGEQLLAPQDLTANPQLKALARQEHSLPVHPAQLYSAFTALLLSALLFAYFTLPHAPGRVFAWMLILEGASRFMLELLRSEPPVNPKWFGPMSLAMVTGLVLLIAGITLWLLFGRLSRLPGWADRRWTDLHLPTPNAMAHSADAPRAPLGSM